MTSAPLQLTRLMAYWVSQGGTNLGIVGDQRHVATGTSYHLAKGQLRADAYSIQTARDKAGLSTYASACDFGKLDGSLANLQKFSRWFVDQCRHNAPDTRDVREFIYSPDGVTVLRWDRERGVGSPPRDGEASFSHRTHSHASYYRDSRLRDQRPVFVRYFEPVGPSPHYAATVTEATALWNPQTSRWAYNGRNNIKPGVHLVVRGAQYTKGGTKCYPVVPPNYGGYFVPVDNVKLGAKVP